MNSFLAHYKLKSPAFPPSKALHRLLRSLYSLRPRLADFRYRSGRITAIIWNFPAKNPQFLAFPEAAALKIFIYSIQYLFVINMQKLANSRHEAGWVTISTDEYESMKATIEILSSPEAMRKIRQGEKELAEGKGKSLKEVKKELGI